MGYPSRVKVMEDLELLYCEGENRLNRQSVLSFVHVTCEFSAPAVLHHDVDISSVYQRFVELYDVRKAEACVIENFGSDTVRVACPVIIVGEDLASLEDLDGIGLSCLQLSRIMNVSLCTGTYLRAKPITGLEVCPRRLGKGLIEEGHSRHNECISLELVNMTTLYLKLDSL